MPINIFTAENTEGRIDVARALESAEAAMYIYDLSPGEAQSPYHYEYNEEWLLVLEGGIILRDTDGEHTSPALACQPSRSIQTATRSASGPATSRTS